MVVAVGNDDHIRLGRSVRSPSPSLAYTQHEPRTTMWNRIRRSAPGWTAPATVFGVDFTENASVSSERKKIAPPPKLPERRT